MTVADRTQDFARSMEENLKEFEEVKGIKLTNFNNGVLIDEIQAAVGRLQRNLINENQNHALKEAALIACYAMAIQENILPKETDNG